MKRKSIAAIAICIATLLLIWGVFMTKTEHEKYDRLMQFDHIELRSYPAQIRAQVITTGSQADSIRAGFQILARFIFGENASQMRIAMTAPVRQQRDKDGWLISFSMPRTFSLDQIPTPTNSSIQIVEDPPTHTLSITFSGRHSDKNIATHSKKLDAFLKSHAIKSTQPFITAFYNPPWTLPFLRRNEVIAKLSSKDAEALLKKSSVA